MMEQVRLCAVWSIGELAWLFHEPHTGLGHCPRILLSCFRARISGLSSLDADMEGGSDAFMSGGEGEKGLPGGEKSKAYPSVEIDIDKYWPFIPLLSQSGYNVWRQ